VLGGIGIARGDHVAPSLWVSTATRAFPRPELIRHSGSLRASRPSFSVDGQHCLRANVARPERACCGLSLDTTHLYTPPLAFRAVVSHITGLADSLTAPRSRQ